MNTLFEILQYKFLTYALIAAFLSAAATSTLSVFVTLKKVSFLGEAFSHIAFAGIALALLISTNVTLTTLVFVLVVAILIAIVSRFYHYQETNIITIFLSSAMALGIILLSLNKNYTPDIVGYLFGNILMINKTDLILLAVLFVVNLLFISLFFKEMFYLTYNYDIARINRIPVNLVYYIFTILLVFNVVISVKIVGIILITAQLILPGITALNLTKNIKKAVLISFILAQIGALGGFFISYLYDLPSGGCIVLLLFTLFIASLLYREIHQKNHS